VQDFRVKKFSPSFTYVLSQQVGLASVVQETANRSSSCDLLFFSWLTCIETISRCLTHFPVSRRRHYGRISSSRPSLQSRLGGISERSRYCSIEPGWSMDWGHRLLWELTTQDSVPGHRAHTTVKLLQDASHSTWLWYSICLQMQNMIAKEPRKCSTIALFVHIVLYFIWFKFCYCI